MKKWIYLIISIAIFTGIFWLSSKDADTSSAQSDELIVKLRLMTEQEIIENPTKAHNYRFVVRKSAHLSVYLIFGIVLYLLFYEFTHALAFSAIVAWVMILIFAGIDEYHQSFVPGRSMEIRDVFIDGTGALIGILIIYLIFKLKERKRPNKNVYYFSR